MRPFSSYSTESVLSLLGWPPFAAKRPDPRAISILTLQQMRNVGLMNAILALSVRHLSLNPVQDSERSYIQNDALPYYHETLHYVQKAMQYDSYNTSDELHATCLIISAYEMLDGSRKDWQRHLQGVFWIQQSQVIHGDSTGVKQAVWWAWLCQDVWAAFRERRKPFTSWRPSKKYAEMNAYEIAARSIYLMAQVVSYCSQEEVEKGKFDVNARILQAETLSMMLDEWQRHTPIEFNPLPLESDSASVFKPIWVNPPAFGKPRVDSFGLIFSDHFQVSPFKCTALLVSCSSSTVLVRGDLEILRNSKSRFLDVLRPSVASQARCRTTPQV